MPDGYPRGLMRWPATGEGLAYFRLNILLHRHLLHRNGAHSSESDRVAQPPSTSLLVVQVGYGDMTTPIKCDPAPANSSYAGTCVQSTQVRSTATELAKTSPLPISQPTVTFRFLSCTGRCQLLHPGSDRPCRRFPWGCGPVRPSRSQVSPAAEAGRSLRVMCHDTRAGGACRAVSCGSGHKESACLALALCAH